MAHMDFGNRLAIYGFVGELEDFDNVLIEDWLKTYKVKFNTVEVFLCHPSTAATFAYRIKCTLGLPNMPTHEILLRLMNIRKRGLLNEDKSPEKQKH